MTSYQPASVGPRLRCLRRRFLLLIAVGAVVALTENRGSRAQEGAALPKAEDDRDTSIFPPLVEMRQYTAAKPFMLVAEMANNKITHPDPAWGERTVRHHSYCGKLVGPALRVRPGETMHVLLKNHFPDEPADAKRKHNEPGEFYTTNLHTHGLHVDPHEKSSDNVFVAVPPKKDHPYTFVIPPDHPAGTFWYHAHHHGSAALQVASGMAGALIVEGMVDELLGEHGIEEKVFVLQQIPYSLDDKGVGHVPEANVYFDEDDQPQNDVNKEFSINGVMRPTLTIQKRVERWRLINAGIRETLLLGLKGSGKAQDKVTFRVIAVDGLFTDTVLQSGTMEPKASLMLAPGSRMDVLVEFNEALDLKFVANYEFVAKTSEGERILATIAVDGIADVRLPDPTAFMRQAKLDCGGFEPPGDDVDKVEKAQADAKVEHEIVFKRNGKHYSINKLRYEEEVGKEKPIKYVTLKKPEVWKLRRNDAVGGHPFHIHTNPFYMVLGSRKGWRDTVSVEDDAKGDLKIYLSPKKFPGDAVMHCHNLHHEDLGMMWKVVFQPEGKVPPVAPGGFAALPSRAPAWRLPDSAQRPHRLDDYAGKDLVLVLFLGAGCSHCMEQLRSFADRKESFERAGLKVVAVCPDAPADLAGPTRHLPFPVLSDPDYQAFRQYGCGEAAAHGTFLIDAQGQVRWQHVAAQPLMDVDRLLRAHAQLSRTVQP